MEIRVSVQVFLISIITIFLILAIKNQFAAIVPVILLYLTAVLGLLVFNYIGHGLLKINFKIVYPVAFIISFFILVEAISLLSGNPFLRTLEKLVMDRKDFFSIADPYILANGVVYLLLSKPPECKRTDKDTVSRIV